MDNTLNLSNEQQKKRDEQQRVSKILNELRSITSDYTVSIGGCAILAVLSAMTDYWYYILFVFILLVICIRPIIKEDLERHENHICNMADELIWMNEHNLPISESDGVPHYVYRYVSLIDLYPELESKRLNKILSKHEGRISWR